jgi:preprotein translocase subunit SecY
MASAAEQLAANINFGALAKAEELKKRIWFTLGALIVYRIGTYIPLPGINPEAVADMFNRQSSGILGMFNMFAGGAVERMAIFALNIMPYISAAIIVQLMTTVSPHLEQLKKEGEQGRKQINQYTRYGTVFLATIQAYGISIGLEGSGNVVIDPGWFFRVTTVITLVGGTVFLMWLGEQVTQRGVGNGISLIIFRWHRRHHTLRACGDARTWPAGRFGDAADLGHLCDAGRRGGGDRLCGARAAAADHPVPQAPGRQSDVPGRSIASAAEAEHRRRHSADLCLIAAAAAGHGRQFHGRAGARMADDGDGAARPWSAALSQRCFYAVGIIFFAFFYTAIVFNPIGHRRQSEEAWRVHSGHPARARRPPNTSTTCSRASRFWARVFGYRLSFAGVLIGYSGIPFYLGGTSLLIVVARHHGHRVPGAGPSAGAPV